MNTELLLQVEKPFLRSFPKFNVGDTIAVKSKFKEGKKMRMQTFKGIVIAIKGSGLRTTFTIRKISYGIGVEKIMPLHSPVIEKIEVLKHGAVRKSKLYYMRKRIGKRALKVTEGKAHGAKLLEAEVIVPEEGKENGDDKIVKEAIQDKSAESDDKKNEKGKTAADQQKEKK